MFSRLIFYFFLIGITNEYILDKLNRPGEEAKNRSDYPYMVSLQKNKKHYCAGTILDEYHILTAAHCLRNKSKITVVSGTLNLKERRGITNKVDAMILHKDYRHGSYHNDIAIIKVKNAFEFNDSIGKVKMSHGTSQKNCSILGWGKTFEENLSSVLRISKVELIEVEACKRFPEKYKNITERQICTFGSSIFSNGDSGGPLMCNGEQIGIASYGPVADTTNLPGIYTDVTKYLDWIDKQKELLKDNTFPITYLIIELIIIITVVFVVCYWIRNRKYYNLYEYGDVSGLFSKI